jgi:hypothetical protein
MYLRGDISILVPDLFRSVVAILTAPAVYKADFNRTLMLGHIYTEQFHNTLLLRRRSSSRP